GPEHRNLAKAAAPCSGALWFVAGGLLPLLLLELLLHRGASRRARHSLCDDSQVPRARTDLAAAFCDLWQHAEAAATNPGEDGAQWLAAGSIAARRASSCRGGKTDRSGVGVFQPPARGRRKPSSNARLRCIEAKPQAGLSVPL